MSNNNKASSRRPRSNSQQQSSNDASELLNFRLSPRPNQTQHHHHRNNTNKRSSQKSYIPKNRLPQGAFPLHTSAQHVFYLSRIDTSNQRKVIQQTTPSKNTPQQQQQHTTLPSSSSFANAKLLQYQGPDTAIPWKSVKMVKRLLVSDGTQTTTTTISTSQCPICLDAFVCPRITKCGHVFCLCCLLQHLEHSKTLSYAAPKCPCCGISPICIEDLKPIEFTNVITPSTSTHSTPPPTNTQQDSTCEGGGQSQQQQQQQQQKHQSSTSTRIQFLKLHRPKESFVPYIPQMGEMKRQQQQQHQQKQQHSNKSSSLLPVQGDNDSKFCRFNFIDTIQYKQELEQNLLELTRLEQDCHTPIERASVFEAMALVHQEQEGSLKTEIQFEQEIGCRMQQQEQQQDANNKNTKITTNASSSSSSSSSYNTIAAISFKNTPSTLFYETYQERQEQQSVENKLQNCPPTSPPDRKLSIESYDGSEASYKEEHTKDDQQNQEEDGSGSPTATTTATLKNAKQRKSKRGGGKHKKHGGRGGSNRPAQYIPPTTMYLEDGSTHFYQSSDGQLCFLSGFNMKCLSTEFSIHSPDFVDDKDTTNKNKDTFGTNNEESPTQQQEQQQQQHYKRPLPDIVEGNVVEVEQMMLTPDLRKRLSFLSHLPLWTDICFVELDLHRLLSDATRKSLKNEFEKRKSRRAKKKQAEKRADRVAQKAEEHRIEELKARYQTIDPNDEFFLPPPQQHELGSDEIFPLDDSFGPSAAAGGGNGSSTSRSAATANNAPTAFSFRAVATVNGANPNLADTSSAEAFPTLGGGSNAMSQSPPKGLSSTINGTGAGATNWGSPPPNHSRGGGYSETSGRREGGRGAPPPPPPSFASATARRESNQITNNAPHHPTKGGRKGKGKKVVLFSTGGHRGTIY